LRVSSSTFALPAPVPPERLFEEFVGFYPRPRFFTLHATFSSIGNIKSFSF
jgi:hypothetical protein